MMKNRMLLMAGALGLLLLITPQSRHGQATQTPMPRVEVAMSMEAVPTDCGQLADSVIVSPEIGNGIGTWPVWAAIPNWAEQVKGILVFPTSHYQKSDQLPGWWVTKMGWFVSETYEGEVTIQAYNLVDGSPLYFEFTDELTALATINPAKPGGFVEGIDDWAFFPSLVWASKAGCYRLEITWDGGGWQQVIAVGSVDQ